MPVFLWPLAAFLFVFALNALVPGRWVDGYVKDPSTGRPLRYRLNGLLILLLCVIGWFFACRAGLLEWTALYDHRWELVVSACVTGLIASAVIVFTAKPVTSNVLADFYLGRIEQPQLWGGRIDAKMYLYLVGAVLLELNLLSFAATHFERYADNPNPGVLLYVALFSFFLCEYLFFEEVHLYTYDFVAERVGFKLTWGCLVFYPWFYAVGLWAVADAPSPERPFIWSTASAMIFFTGWCFARGANMQKYWFKRDPKKKAFGFIEPEALQGRVLVNGFWGLSRHVNYLGELMMATGLTFALGHVDVWQTWLYPLYYVVLLFPRQLADDRRCEAKYGPLWKTYVARVKWRIIPFVY